MEWILKSVCYISTFPCIPLRTALNHFKYSVDEYENALAKVTFPNYAKYHNVNKAYNDFFSEIDWGG